MMNKKEFSLALIISVAIAVAILSLPDIMEPIAENILNLIGNLIPIALLLIGIIHGIKPDEHTWPITVSYAMMQSNIKGVILSTITFTSALTLVWTLLSILINEALSLGLGEGKLDPEVDIIVGLTMISVALFYIIKGKTHSTESKRISSPDYRMIWIHGVAAAFGGDFFVVLLLAVSIYAISPSFPIFSVGLLFGLGSMLSQLIIVLLLYKGMAKVIKTPELLINSGKLALMFLGVFMIILGTLNFL